VLTEEDTGPLVAIDADGDSDLLVSMNSPKVILEDEDGEEESRDLTAELEAKLESGTASKRLERRMKRKDDREAQEIFENMAKHLPPLTLPGSLPIIAAPILSELPPLPPPPAPGEMPMLLGDGNLPPLPLPAMPAPERKVTCSSCGAGITVKDMTLRKMDCPICSEIINM
jgi:hypothetical protein